MHGMAKLGLAAAAAVMISALPSSPGSAADRKVFYLLSHGGPSDAFWIDWNAAAVKACDRLDVTCKISFSGGDMAAQKEALNTAIAAKPDGIATTSAQPGLWPHEVAAAKKAGIPIIFFNTDDPSTGREAYVGADLKEVGAIWARYLVDHKMVKKGDNVFLPVEVPGASYQQLETEGVASVFDPLGVKYDVVDCGTDPAGMISKMTNYLVAHNPPAIIALGELGRGERQARIRRRGRQAWRHPGCRLGQFQGHRGRGQGGLRRRRRLAVPLGARIHARRHSLSRRVGRPDRLRHPYLQPLRQEQRRADTRGLQEEEELNSDASAADRGRRIAVIGRKMVALSDKPRAKRISWSGAVRSPQFSALIILCVVLAAFTIGNNRFLSPLNVSNIMAFLPELGIIALGMTLLMTAGEFDLSVGAVFALGPVVVMMLVENAGVDLGMALLVGLAICILAGAINGILVTKIGISSFLVTLSMLLILRGVALYITQGFPLKPWDQPGPLVTLLAGSFEWGPFRFYTSLWWFIALTLLSIYTLDYAKLGNWISAIGSNRFAAVARGVPADRVKIGLFILTSVLSGLAGMISAFRISAASPVAGTGYELEVIAMVVVGGTALTGGRGTILGTLVGVFMLRTISDGITLVGVPGLAYNIFVGTIILAMLVLHALVQKARS